MGRFNLISGHLDTSGTTVRVLFTDFFWSAFNIVQPHVLIQNLLNLEIDSDLVLWIRQFLCDRQQRVSLNSRLCGDSVFSDELTLKTGVPKGCVFFPPSNSLFHLHKRHFLQ